MNGSAIGAAAAFLTRLGQLGVKYLFANSGTDFAPLIEAYESATDEQLKRWPRPLAISHETVAVSMAHGAFLTAGQPQAVMVHVNVGLANSLMGLINAQSDNIPILMFAGRTPLTEYQREGARMTPIQYGQEMRDQSGMLRDVVKWDYEIRYGEQIVDAVDRAYSIAMSKPEGPVFLGLPREPLAETIAGGRSPDHPIPPVAPQLLPEPELIAQLADRIAGAQFPLIICQRGDPEGKLGALLESFCSDNGIAVVEPFVIRNLMPADHPCHLGYQMRDLLAQSDCLVVIDSPVPWIQRFASPSENCFVAHLGSDPLFSNLPMRNFPADLLIRAAPHLIVEQLSQALEGRCERVAERLQKLAEKKRELNSGRDRLVQRLKEREGIAPGLVSAALATILNESTLVFSELGPPPDLAAPTCANQWFTPPYSGGLGWGVPAAIGAKLAQSSKTVIACVGDGSYIFANPVACNHVMASLSVPVLVIILNNSSWNATRRAAHNMYPSGSAAQCETPVLTSLEPSPDFVVIAQANGGWARRVTERVELDQALAEALLVIDREQRSATLEIQVTKTDGF